MVVPSWVAEVIDWLVYVLWQFAKVGPVGPVIPQLLKVVTGCGFWVPVGQVLAAVPATGPVTVEVAVEEPAPFVAVTET